MDVSYATAAAPGRSNEDFIVANDSFVVVLDGVTEPNDRETGCSHGVGWLVERLGERLAQRLAIPASDAGAAEPLADLLATAIADVKGDHGIWCDLSHPDTPSATVAIVRERDAELEYLVLCDSTVVLDGLRSWVAVTDNRTAFLPSYDRQSVGRLRNSAGGFWVASTLPEAAYQALHGRVDRQSLRSVLLCTDGVSRLVEYFGWTWPEVIALAHRDGPTAVVDAVRAAEGRSLPGPRPWKIHDDATVAIGRLRS